jgi:hypothetical protein
MKMKSAVYLLMLVVSGSAMAATPATEPTDFCTWIGGKQFDQESVVKIFDNDTRTLTRDDTGDVYNLTPGHQKPHSVKYSNTLVKYKRIIATYAGHTKGVKERHVLIVGTPVAAETTAGSITCYTRPAGK